MTGNEAFLAILKVLNNLEIPYMVVGSYSSNFYGIPRSTKDADLVIHFQSGYLEKIAAKLPPEIALDQQGSFEMVTATRKELLRIKDSIFEIELFHLSDDSFDLMRFGRRQKVIFHEDLCAWMPTVEDVVVQKLRWAKSGRRTKDFDDVVAILSVQKEVDFSYITKWCSQHGTLEMLAQARTEASA
ncbi:MAG: hypothetical protein V4727_01850 [Verrucomicrobiota bacterium]